jgi:hypothetical protein
MTPEQIAVLGLIVTTIITAVGWGITTIVQFIILRKTKQTQDLDRELAVFRERLNTIKKINSSLIALTTPYLKLTTLFYSNHFTFEEGRKIMEEMKTESTLGEILYDPEYRMLQNLLPKEKADMLDSQITKIGTKSSIFHGLASSLSSLGPRPDILQKQGTHF